MHPSPKQLKDFILNINEPYVIKKINLEWHTLHLSLYEFCSLFNEDVITFDTGKRNHHQYPQWERDRNPMKMNLKEFLQKFHEKESKEIWSSYGYKNLEELPLTCRKGVNFERLGFDDLKDVSVWLGSKGAHTACHYDQYGCNIVVQVYGRKSWLLFPPGTALTPTRIPFEESSVYCMENFYSPSNLEQFKAIETAAHSIILEPGDILIVPPKWWHFVENLETALSINTWIPLQNDLNSQLEECFVKTQIYQLTQNLSENFKKALINPNELDDFFLIPLQDQLKLLKNLAEHVSNPEMRQTLNKQLKTHASNYLDADQLQSITEQFSEFHAAVPKISESQFYDILMVNSTRFRTSSEFIVEEYEQYRSIANYINSICSPRLIDMFKENYLKTL